MLYANQRNQQHPDFFFSSVFLREVPGLVAFPPGAPVLVGLPWTFDLISLERVVNAFSTLTASLADVSRNLMPSESASVFPEFKRKRYLIRS